MRSVFSRWASRIGKGQRSHYDESTAVIFINTDLAVNGDPARQLPPLRPYLAGSSGTINVASHIATSYIEKIVYRMQSAQAAIIQRSIDPSTPTLAQARSERPSHSGSSMGHLSGVDPTARLRPDLSQGLDFTLQDNRLLVIYDSRFVEAKIYGYVGGADIEVDPLLKSPNRRSATQCFYCRDN